jgi:hypothetical protein
MWEWSSEDSVLEIMQNALQGKVLYSVQPKGSDLIQKIHVKLLERGNTYCMGYGEKH